MARSSWWFLLTVVVAFPARAGTPLTLDEALRLAQARYPTVRGAALTEQATQHGLAAARSARWPALGISGGYLHTSPNAQGNPSFVANNAPDEYRAQIGITQPLYSGGALGAAISKAEADREAARADAQVAARQLGWQVTSQFFGVLKARDTLRLNELARVAAEAHLREGQVLLRHGALSRLDATRNQLDVSNAQLDVERASGDLTVATRQLAESIGGPVPSSLATPDVTRGSRLSLDEAIARTAARPEVASARAKARSAEADWQITQSALRPQVQAVAGAGWDAATFYSPSNAGWDAGLNVSVPLFDWGRLAAQARSSELTYRRATEDIRLAELTVRTEVVQAYTDRDVAERQAQTAAESLSLAQQAATMAQTGYRMGSISNLEFELTRQQLSVAQRRLASARMDAMLAALRLRWALGEALP